MTITLVLGGARSGKSAYAEALVAQAPVGEAGEAPIYLATASAGDDEMARRIADHRSRRGPAWSTIEQPLAIAKAISDHATTSSAMLIDCLTLWLSNLIQAGRDIDAKTDALIAALTASQSAIVVVSNQLGDGIVPDNLLARTFRDAAGRLNQRVAAAADTVVLITAGLPLTLKRDGKILHG